MQQHTPRGLVAFAIAALAVAALLGLLSREAAPRPASPASEGLVTYVYDGDTIEVDGVGKVRIIGIDALDGYNAGRTAEQAQRYGMPAARVKQWAQEATRFARRALDGQRVRLEYGPERSDVYGRVLAYVIVGDGAEDFSLMMIDEGLAAAYEGFEHPRRAQYLRAQDRAQSERAGLWEDAQVRP